MSKKFRNLQFYIAVCVLLMCSLISVSGATSQNLIPMENIGLGTYYVNVKLANMPESQFMVDTGSGYMTINEESLTHLKKEKRVRYIKSVNGILANGSTFVVEVWELSSITLNNQCTLRNVEVAVFPGKTRQILGLSALKKAAPLELSFDPPVLALGHCEIS